VSGGGVVRRDHRQARVELLECRPDVGGRRHRDERELVPQRGHGQRDEAGARGQRADHPVAAAGAGGVQRRAPRRRARPQHRTVGHGVVEAHGGARRAGERRPQRLPPEAAHGARGVVAIRIVGGAVHHAHGNRTRGVRDAPVNNQPPRPRLA
jgi:hypothetical protein